MVGVVAILLILTFRFTNLDFKINQSAFTLIGVFLIYANMSILVNNVNPFVGFIINFVSTLLLIVLTCNNMMFCQSCGNFIILLLLYGNPVTTLNSFY